MSLAQAHREPPRRSLAQGGVSVYDRAVANLYTLHAICKTLYASFKNFVTPGSVHQRSFIPEGRPQKAGPDGHQGVSRVPEERCPAAEKAWDGAGRPVKLRRAPTHRELVRGGAQVTQQFVCLLQDLLALGLRAES